MCSRSGRPSNFYLSTVDESDNISARQSIECTRILLYPLFHYVLPKLKKESRSLFVQNLYALPEHFIKRRKMHAEKFFKVFPTTRGCQSPQDNASCSDGIALVAISTGSHPSSPTHKTHNLRSYIYRTFRLRSLTSK